VRGCALISALPHPPFEPRFIFSLPSRGPVDLFSTEACLVLLYSLLFSFLLSSSFASQLAKPLQPPKELALSLFLCRPVSVRNDHTVPLTSSSSTIFKQESDHAHSSCCDRARAPRFDS